MTVIGDNAVTVLRLVKRLLNSNGTGMVKRMGLGLMMITRLRFALNSNGIVVVNSKETIITGLRLAALLWRRSCEH